MNTFSSKSRTRGYTISELLIAMSISVVIGGAATWFLVEGTRSSLKTTNLSLSDLSQWSIFTAISVDSKVANGMSVYGSFTESSMADSTMRKVNGERGNVLILSRSTQPTGSKKATYKQITGYVFTPGTKLLRKFTYEVPASEQGNPATGVEPATLEEILVNNLRSFSFSKVSDELVSVDAGGVFLVRQTGQSGILAVESQQGGASGSTAIKKLIEASFFIRG